MTKVISVILMMFLVLYLFITIFIGGDSISDDLMDSKDKVNENIRSGFGLDD